MNLFTGNFDHYEKVEEFGASFRQGKTFFFFNFYFPFVCVLSRSKCLVGGLGEM